MENGNEAAPEVNKISNFRKSKGIDLIQYRTNEDNSSTLELNEDILKQLLLHPQIKYRYVSVISIAGAYKEGKSLLLNFLLFYLEVKYVKKLNVEHWLDSNYGKVKGFNYQHGSDPTTKGIVIWPEVFLTTISDGKKVAILLMDTQGAFDGHSSFNDFATLFALSSIISSVQIYNVMNRVNTSHLKELECFAGLSTFMGQMFCKFQKLLFLVRDWGCSFEKPFGANGGKLHLDTVFTSEKNSEQTRDIVSNLRNMFTDDIQCFLLPRPGEPVADKGSFEGDIEDVNQEFVKHVETLAKSLLSPENLILKKIQNTEITAEQLFEHIVKYTDIFKNGQLPLIKDSLFSIMRQEFIDKIMNSCKIFFENAFKLGKFDEFDDVQLSCEKIVTDYFKECCKNIISPEGLPPFLSILSEQINLLSFKCKDWHTKETKADEKCIQDILSASGNSYNKGMDSAYNDIVVYLFKEECIKKHKELFMMSDSDYKTKMDEFFTKLDKEIYQECSKNVRELLKDISLESWDNYKNKFNENLQKRKQIWRHKWILCMNTCHNLRLGQNEALYEKFLAQTHTTLDKKVEDLAAEYNRKLEDFAKTKRFLGNGNRFLHSFRAEHYKIRAELLRQFKAVKVTRGFESIKEDARLKLCTIWHTEFEKNEKGLKRILFIYKVIKFIGLNAAVTAIGAVIVALAPASGFLAIIARIIGAMPK